MAQQSSFLDKFSISTQRWFFVGWILFVLASCVLSRDCITERTPEEVQKLIDNNVRLKRVDQLCKSIPKPKSWKFIRKKLGGNSNTAAISFYFRTNLDSNEFDKIDLSWFEKNGWKPEYNNSLYFKKNNQYIVVEGTNQSRNFSVYCAEKY